LSQLDHATIDDLQATRTTVEDVVTITQVNCGDKNLVKCFLDYVIHRNTSDHPIDDHWTDITQADFDAYRVSPTYMAAWLPPLIIPRTGVIGATTSTAVPLSPSAPTRSQTRAELFRRGIKKDPALFPTLKDESSMTIGISLLLIRHEPKMSVKSLMPPMCQLPMRKQNFSQKNRSMYMLFWKQKFLRTEVKP
jgi:hypothetical protein